MLPHKWGNYNSNKDIKVLHPLLKLIINNSKGYPHRNIAILGRDLKTIFDYDPNIYNHFENRIINGRDIKNFWNGIFAEIIVTASYLRKGFKVDIIEKEADLILKVGNDTAYLEILSINPESQPDMKVHESKTHLPVVNTSSIRGKLCNKLGKGQFKKGRINVAIIELNSPGIAGDFAIQSSLSDGYKVAIDKKSMKIVGGGFDWQNNNFFETEDGKKISAIIWFDMGDYENRRKIKNPNATCLIDDTTLEKL